MSWMRFTAVALIVFATVDAKDKKPKTPPKDPQDSIEVVGHIPLAGGPVCRFITTQHYSSYYLYAEHEGGRNLTLIDVTRAARPVVLAEVPYPAAGGSASLFAVAGTAALVTDAADGVAAMPKGQTLRIMDFSDPLHPKVAREFTSVTSMSRDERRGLIFLANGEGIWILHQTYAEDPKVQEEYAKHVMYDH
ncbi:MAG TPA: hypothetical protein VML19_14990 [Verrucomicrobiae bacterium]|nr:hypothetical protein [Verrucomicrobiae bacterium]